MRIAIVDPSLFSPPYDLALAKGLQSHGLDVCLVTRSTRRGEHKMPSQLHQVRFYKWSEFFIQKFGPKLIFKVIKGLEHLVDAIRFGISARDEFDVIHLQWLTLPFFDWLMLKLLKGHVPVVLTLHDSKPFLGGQTSFLQTWGWGECLHLADRIIVHTQSARDSWIKNGVNGDKIEVIPHGHLQLGEKFTDLGFRKPFAEKAILLFGIIKHYKGVDILLKAFAKVAPELRMGWRLWIVGKPFDDVQPLLNLADELNIANEVTWDLRFVPDAEIPSIYEQSDMMVFPYREIDASGVFLSSMTYGKATIATRVGLFAELLAHQKSALLVDRENVEDLAKSLSLLLQSEELRTRLGAGLKDLASEQSSWTEIGKKTFNVYRSLRR